MNLQKAARSLVLPLALLASTATLLGQNGFITTVAGNGVSGTSGVGGPATSASIAGGMIAVDSSDNIYIADRTNNRVVKVDAVTGILTLVAGNGTAASAGDGGPAAQASLNGPTGLVVDPSGNLYISENTGNRIRRIDRFGIITTYAGTGAGGFSGDGGPATNGTFYDPYGLALDSAGNLYIADALNLRVRRVDASTGILTTVAGTGVNAHAPDGTPASSASLAGPFAVSFDAYGNLLITEAFGYDIRTVVNGVLGTLAGNGSTTFNGDGEAATSAAIGMLASNVTFDAAGNLYFADGTGRVRRVDFVTGAITTVAGSGAGAHLQTSSSAGGGGSGSYTCPGNLGDGGPATIATLDGVVGVALTSTGQLLMGDYIDCRVRSVPLPSPLLYTTTGLTLSGTTLTATVSPIGGSTTPTGTVEFMQYESYGAPLPLASATLVNGTATVGAGGLPAGSYQVMAIYGGENLYNGSGSSAVAVTGSGLPIPQFASNVPNPVPVSMPVTIQVSVNGSRGPATGSISLYDGSMFLTTAPLVNGIASFQYSSIVAGTHQINVQYPGDTNYASASWTFSFQVLAPIPTTTTMSSGQNPNAVNSTVGMFVTVTPQSSSSSTMTGSVQVLEGATVLGTANVQNGSASVYVSFSTTGAHTVRAVYSGDANFAGSTSAPLSQVVKNMATGIIATSLNPAGAGVPITFNATVFQSAATGSVTFNDRANPSANPVALGAVPLSNGQAAFTTSKLSVGTHLITGAYSGDANYVSFETSYISEVVNLDGATTTLISSQNPTPPGVQVTFQATVTPAAGSTLQPSGVVQLLDGTTVLTSANVTNGGAQLTYTFGTWGSHSLTAAYSGDANFSASTSAVLTQAVKSTSSMTLNSTPNPSTDGATVTFTAIVQQSGATGTVTLLDGAATIGTATLNSGSATFSVALAAGSHSITTNYGGDNNFQASSASLTQVVRANTTTSLAANPTTATVAQAVQFTATVTPSAATGTVQFFDSGTSLGTATVSNGAAVLAVSTLTAGTHNVNSLYSGDSNYASSSSSYAGVVINKVTTTLAIASNTASINVGQAVQLTASVTPATATGSVQFLDGSNVLGTATMNNGSASLSVSSLAAGIHSITASYGGDAADTTSTSSAVSVTVSKIAATITMASSLNPSAVGQSVTFTATVSPSGATGAVQFLNGSTVLGAATLSSGTAYLAVSNLPAGTQSITAAYSGDATYNSIGTSLVQTVKATSATGLSASSTSINVGQTVQLTASVTPSAATGTVQFLDGSSPIGAVTLSGGMAVLSVSSLAAGTHSITASYGGDAGDAPSTSSSVNVTVSKLAATVAIASSLNPSVSGQSVTFVATVSPSGATGAVQFLDGSTVLGAAALSGGSAAFTTAVLAAGSHGITASYSGDGTYNSASSSGLAQLVKAVTTTSVTSNPNPSVAGQTVQFVAALVPSTATGTVQFNDGGTALGSATVNGGMAVYSIASLAAGNHSITAVYAGDANDTASASAVYTQTVNLPPPGAPSNLTANVQSYNQINLQWHNSPTSGVTYNVYASTTPGFTPSPSSRIASGVNHTNYNAQGLSPSTTYYFLVTSQNSNGESAPSNQASGATPSGIGCHVDYNITNQNGSQFGISISFHNTGIALTSWTMTWTFGGNQQITQSWNANYSQSGANATLTNASWNGSVASNATVSGIGFNGTYSGSNNKPQAFYIDGTPCN